MGKLVYSMITLTDGYVQDADGNFEWGTPDQELHEFITHLTEGVGTCLYGRRMYETMSYTGEHRRRQGRQGDVCQVGGERLDVL